MNGRSVAAKIGLTEHTNFMPRLLRPHALTFGDAFLSEGQVPVDGFRRPKKSAAFSDRKIPEKMSNASQVRGEPKHKQANFDI